MKYNKKEIMSLAWQFIKANGLTLSKALKLAWMNIKLRTRMMKDVVTFIFQKADGTLRRAEGTLKETMLPNTKGSERKVNPLVQVFFDTDKGEWRSYKKANIVTIY